MNDFKAFIGDTKDPEQLLDSVVRFIKQLEPKTLEVVDSIRDVCDIWMLNYATGPAFVDCHKSHRRICHLLDGVAWMLDESRRPSLSKDHQTRYGRLSEKQDPGTSTDQQQASGEQQPTVSTIPLPSASSKKGKAAKAPQQPTPTKAISVLVNGCVQLRMPIEPPRPRSNRPKGPLTEAQKKRDQLARRELRAAGFLPPAPPRIAKTGPRTLTDTARRSKHEREKRRRARREMETILTQAATDAAAAVAAQFSTQPSAIIVQSSASEVQPTSASASDDLFFFKTPPAPTNAGKLNSNSSDTARNNLRVNRNAVPETSNPECGVVGRSPATEKAPQRGARNFEEPTSKIPSLLSFTTPLPLSTCAPIPPPPPPPPLHPGEPIPLLSQPIIPPLLHPRDLEQLNRAGPPDLFECGPAPPAPLLHPMEMEQLQRVGPSDRFDYDPAFDQGFGRYPEMRRSPSPRDYLASMRHEHMPPLRRDAEYPHHGRPSEYFDRPPIYEPALERRRNRREPPPSGRRPLLPEGPRVVYQRTRRPLLDRSPPYEGPR